VVGRVDVGVVVGVGEGVDVGVGVGVGVEVGVGAPQPAKINPTTRMIISGSKNSFFI